MFAGNSSIRVHAEATVIKSSAEASNIGYGPTHQDQQIISVRQIHRRSMITIRMQSRELLRYLERSW